MPCCAFAAFVFSQLVLGLAVVKRVVFGDVANEGVASLQDLDRREFFILGVLAVAVLLLGVWPQPLVNVMGETLRQLLEHVVQSKL